MRLNIPLCLSILGGLASFSSVSARDTYSRQFQLAERDAELISVRNDAGLLGLRDDGILDIRGEDDLDLRDEGTLDIRDVEALYEVLVRRAPKKTAAEARLRKVAAAAHAGSNGKAPTPKGRPKTAKHIATQKAANDRTAARKFAGREKFGAAAAAHKATTNLPGNHDVFKVPNRRTANGKIRGPTYTGKEVKKAVFDSHMEREANKSKTNRQRNLSALKKFENNDHKQKHANSPTDVRPIKHMSGKGHEYPIGNDYPIRRLDPKGPARVITQKTKQGHMTFKGVVAHDIGRQAGDHGYNDHFQVKPNSP